MEAVLQTVPEQGSPRARDLLPVPSGPLRVAARPAAGPPVRLSLVIPTFNEGRNIKKIVGELTRILHEPLGGSYELIVVDDDSPDRTWEIAEGLTQSHPRLRVMRRRGERGLSSAVIRGWQAARGEVLAVIDADLQHPPEIAAALWGEIEQGADLAVGSRHVAGGGVSDWALHRRILSRGAQLVGLMLLPRVLGRVGDPMSGCFMVRRRAIAGRTMSPLGYKILIEVLGRGDVGRIAEVGYVFRERALGESKVSPRLYVDYLRHLLRLRLSTLPVARFARFCLVGGSGVVVDMGLLHFLSAPDMLGWGLTVSKIVAAEVAIMNNFLWNDSWTFRDAAQGGLHGKLERFTKFNAICSAGLLLNVLLLNLQVHVLGVNRYLANAITIAVVTVWNFGLNSRFSWRAAGAPRQGRATACSPPADEGTAPCASRVNGG
ncbi:glycosyltransferase [Sorangium sp. So ce1128]